MSGLPYNYFTMKNLSASLEDYLEIIYNSLEETSTLIAKKLNISRASVSEALSKLEKKDLIINEGHKGIIITEKGINQAKKVLTKHKTLTSFFESTLGLDKESAENNACKIEHVITDDLFKRIESFQKYCNENSEYINKFKKGYIEKNI